MLLCVDVDYRDPARESAPTTAVVAGVVAAAWTDAVPLAEVTVAIDSAKDYKPGEFYRRELPCILALLEELPDSLNQLDGLLVDRIDRIVIDGYVHLDAERSPGLGAHLWRALDRSVPVVGVAKTRYRGAPAIEVLRGQSARPLFVTSVGVDVDQAAAWVRAMHGEHRLPTLLKRVDRLCKDS